MTAPAGEGQQDNGQGDKGAGGEQSGTITQEQMNRLLASQKREIESKFDGYDDLKAKAGQYDSLTESVKSDIEKANEAASDFKSKWESEAAGKSQLQIQLDQQKIAATKGLDPDLWDRIKGSTKEEIEADVDRLVAKFAPPESKFKAPPTRLRSGSSAPDGASDKQKAAAALREMRRT